MLVLTRKLNDSILINDNIRVTVVGIKGGKVRIAIEAPSEVPVDREEVYLRRQEFLDIDLAVLQG